MEWSSFLSSWSSFNFFLKDVGKYNYFDNQNGDAQWVTYVRCWFYLKQSTKAVHMTNLECLNGVGRIEGLYKIDEWGIYKFITHFDIVKSIIAGTLHVCYLWYHSNL